MTRRLFWLQHKPEIRCLAQVRPTILTQSYGNFGLDESPRKAGHSSPRASSPTRQAAVLSRDRSSCGVGVGLNSVLSAFQGNLGAAPPGQLRADEVAVIMITWVHSGRVGRATLRRRYAGGAWGGCLTGGSPGRQR